MNGPIVTPADHDAGFKDLEVTFRSGKRETIRLSAPSYRAAQQLALKLQQTKDVLCVTEACFSPLSPPRSGRGNEGEVSNPGSVSTLQRVRQSTDLSNVSPSPRSASEQNGERAGVRCPEIPHSALPTPHFLDRLTLESASLVESISFALTFGDEFQKKMAAFGRALLQPTDSTDSAPKSKSSAPVTLLRPSGDLACPNCGSTIAYVAKPEFWPISAPSTSAPPPA